MTYACPAWQFAAESQLLQIKVLRSIGNVPRHTPTCDLHVAFRTLYLFDFVTKLCRQQETITLNNENVIIRNADQGLNLVAVRHMIEQMSRLWSYPWAVSIICCTKPGLQA
jgi:hypothetical protein